MVLVLLVVSVLMVAAAAFVTMSLTEAKALGYRTAERQAIMGCRSGLEHAIAIIEETISQEAGGSFAATPDGIWALDSNGAKVGGGLTATDGWAGFFATQGSGAITQPDEEDGQWLDHYGTDDYGNEAYAFAASRSSFSLGYVLPGPVNVLAGEYAVYVNDLDGRVHTNPDYFDGALGSGASAKGLVTELVDGLDLSAQQEQALEGKDECEYMSPTELKPRCDLSWVQMYDVLALFTPYPVGNPAVPPAVNVNTARRQTIRAALTQVPSLENQDLEIDELVDRMAQQRPFGKRKALESVVYNHFKPKFDAAPNEGERKKVEKRFNDVLNSLNGTEASDYRLPGDTTGVYQYDLENSQFTGGEHTSDADVTWGCEFKFSSRFYRVVVLGRGWRKGSGRSRTVRRWLEAVYDAAGDKIIWQRVHLTPDFNIITN